LINIKIPLKTNSFSEKHYQEKLSQYNKLMNKWEQ